jgi:hypothetical protein
MELHPTAHAVVGKIVAVLVIVMAISAQAQDRIYRCGNEYTNNPTPAQKKECKALDGGNVTVVQGVKPRSASNGKAPGPAVDGSGQPKVDPNQQKARDADARAILEAELRRAETRLADVQREYNNGMPDRLPLEARNPAFYAQRVQDLKASLGRAEADVVGIRRELARLASAGVSAR